MEFTTYSHLFSFFLSFFLAAASVSNKCSESFFPHSKSFFLRCISVSFVRSAHSTLNIWFLCAKHLDFAKFNGLRTLALKWALNLRQNHFDIDILFMTLIQPWTFDWENRIAIISTGAEKITQNTLITLPNVTMITNVWYAIFVCVVAAMIKTSYIRITAVPWWPSPQNLFTRGEHQEFQAQIYLCVLNLV